MNTTRNYCFTIDWPTDDDINLLHAVDCNYMIYSHGTDMICGLVILHTTINLHDADKLLGAHSRIYQCDSVPRRIRHIIKLSGMYKSRLYNRGRYIPQRQPNRVHLTRDPVTADDCARAGQFHLIDYAYYREHRVQLNEAYMTANRWKDLAGLLASDEEETIRYQETL